MSQSVGSQEDLIASQPHPLETEADGVDAWLALAQHHLPAFCGCFSADLPAFLLPVNRLNEAAHYSYLAAGQVTQLLLHPLVRLCGTPTSGRDSTNVIVDERARMGESQIQAESVPLRYRSHPLVLVGGYRTSMSNILHEFRSLISTLL